jgi:murein DD-endopeptidase MepM/ murein hydrolase activator NlpD
MVALVLAAVSLMTAGLTAGCTAGAANNPVAVRDAGVGAPSTGVPTSPSAGPSPSASPAPPRYAFPVAGSVSYAHEHHDYPATDVMAPCGAAIRAVTDGMVLEVNRIDRYDPKVDDGATRGGLYVSILGDDGVRYYGSHYRAIEPGIVAGVRVSAGQTLGYIGETGDASACHLHFGISPVCARVGDWWVRRGTIWPWTYLDSWRKGGGLSPVAAIAAWHQAHGCPTQPTGP